ncbi:MAG: universal stress protein [Actinomycetia bacterium]|nr:universal stress protein [Actinomycetes bacterium]
MTTIVVGYVSRPEGRAALRVGVAEAKLRGARLLVVNSTKGGQQVDVGDAAAVGEELDAIRQELAQTGLDFEVRELARGEEVSEDIISVAEESDATFIVIGLRRRTPVGKLIMGSHAQRILLDASCPVLAVKAGPEDEA